MKKILYVLLIGFCLIFVSACGNINGADELDNITSVKESSESTSERNDQKESVEDINSKDGLAVVPGTYEIGDYITSANYLITCEKTNYLMQVIVFENKDDYNNYKSANRITNGEEMSAIEQNALYDYYLEEGEVGYISLGEGYVLLINNGSGNLNELDVQDTANTNLYTGRYYIGDDIEASHYLFTCNEADYSMSVLVFESMEKYRDYHQTSRFTNGEELAAIEQNALYDYYLEVGENGFLALANGYVLLIDNGNGTLDEIDTNNNMGLCRGVYFVGDDVEAAQYSLTCIDSFMKVTVFETVDTYKDYHQTSRFTVGEESDAIKQNAISSEYIYEGDTVTINLQNGNVLLISDGGGNLEKLGE